MKDVSISGEYRMPILVQMSDLETGLTKLFSVVYGKCLGVALIASKRPEMMYRIEERGKAEEWKGWHLRSWGCCRCVVSEKAVVELLPVD